MPNRFIIFVDGETSGDREAITAFFKTGPHPWWHHFQHVWLLEPIDSGVELSDLRDRVLEAGSGNYKVLVLEFNGHVGYAGYGPKGLGDWLGRNWGWREKDSKENE